MLNTVHALTETIPNERAAEISDRLAILCSYASDAVHDLGNDHAIAMSHCELVLRRLDQNTENARHLASAIGAIMRANNRARRLLAFSPDYRPKIEPIDLRSLILDNQVKLREQLGSDIVLVLELDEDVPLIAGDDELVLRLLSNLLFNSRTALRGLIEPKVTIALSEKLNGPSSVQLGFRDNGRGMSAATVQQILGGISFSTKSGDHTGLGMGIVRTVIKQCGGQMNLTSAEGSGSAFTFLFPSTPSA